MGKVVESRVKELEEGKRRDFNVLLFNMSEAVRNSPEKIKLQMKKVSRDFVHT